MNEQEAFDDSHCRRHDGAMTAPMAAQAVKYKLSGQVNRATLFQDDGVQSGVRHVDNISSGTRFRLKGSEDIGNGMNWVSPTNPNGLPTAALPSALI